jgi:predicted aconitase
MELTTEEQQIYDGEQGETLAKILKSVLRFGEIFGAKRLVPVNKPVHLVASFGVPMLKPIYDLMDELIENNIKTKLPFTVDPRPVDHASIKYTLPEKLAFKFMYGKQSFYENQLKQVGLKDENAFTCACYHQEVGNIPEKGDILAWSESSAVVYANSVIGARTNRNSAIIDLFCGILGLAPEYGLLTDNGRKASWLIEVNTDLLPTAQILGSAIGLKVMEDVPYIKGLANHFKNMSSESIKDYLQELGAAAASNGAVGLFHVENCTPEALELGEKLISANYKTYKIDAAELDRTKRSYPILWKKPDAKPELCFIGCPHLSLNQLNWWTDTISEVLQKNGKNTLQIKTVFTAAPDVAEQFKKDIIQFEKFKKTGARLSSVCALMNMNNPILARKRVITNSNKLRTYTSTRYYQNDEIIAQICGGIK